MVKAPCSVFLFIQVNFSQPEADIMAMFPIFCSSLCPFPPPSAASQRTHNGQTLHTANPLHVEPKKTYLTIPFIITTVGFILLCCPLPVCVPFMPFTAGQATAGTQRAEADGQHTNWLLHFLVLREDCWIYLYCPEFIVFILRGFVRKSYSCSKI